MTREKPEPGRAAPTAEQLLDTYRSELQARFPLPPARKPRRAKKVVQGALVLLLGAAGLVWLDPAYRSESYASGIHRLPVMLADGSQVMLDAGTELRVGWHFRSRRLELLRGRARFAVQRQVWRPLTVEAGELRAKVLGTTFTVDRRDDGGQVMVMEGVVAVTSTMHGQSVRLGAGEQAELHGGRLERLAKVDTEAGIAWVRGRLLFDRTPLGEALVQMRRYHNAPIRLSDPSLAELRLSGGISTERVDTFLQTLPAILPVVVEEEADGSILIGRR